MCIFLPRTDLGQATDPPVPTPRRPGESGVTRTLVAGFLFEVGLGLLALALGSWAGQPPFATLSWDGSTFLAGVFATAPMLAGFFAVWRSPHRLAAGLRERIDEIIATMFRRASVVEVGLIALAAGIAEEALFRGFLQGLFESHLGPPAGLLAASFLFGLAHPLTRGYVVVATVLGYYLGWLWRITGNLLAPITAHTLYDFSVLLILIRDQRSDIA